MRNDLKIAGWIKNSFIDYPGTVSTVLFLSGCNLRCPFCHNPSVVRDELPAVSIEEVLAHLDKRRGIIDGVVISGGEPTIYPALPFLIDTLREHDLKIKLDTNGLQPELVSYCSPDYLALDIKTSPSKYNLLGTELTDIAQRLEKSLHLVREMGENGEVRIPVVPGFIDEGVIRELIVVLEGVSKVYLQPFQNRTELLDLSFQEKDCYPSETIDYFCSLIKDAGIPCVIRGM